MIRFAIAAAGIILTATVLPATGARADSPPPPPRYDQPYAGKLTITTAAAMADVAKACPAALGTVVACATWNKPPGTCRIVILTDSGLRAAGFTTRAVMRHELGHCNGWRHAGPCYRCR